MKKSRMSLRGSLATAAISCLLFLAACGGDSSTSSDDFSDSSSSVIPGIDPESSSGSAQSSSSKDELKSSSSGKDESSSSSRHSPLDGESSSSGQKKSCDDLTYNPDTQLCDTRDGTLYRFVTIESERPAYSKKKWMAENLSFQTENSWCGGGSGTTEGNCETYGRLYTWAAAMGKSEEQCGSGNECDLASAGSATFIQGVCPDGWHVPTREEWEALIAAVGDRSTAGAKLKAQTLWSAYDGITNEDAYGFSALPAGNRYSSSGRFNRAGDDAYFWSATEFASDYAYFMGLYYNDDYADLSFGKMNDGFSVRCLQD